MNEEAKSAAFLFDRKEVKIDGCLIFHSKDYCIFDNRSGEAKNNSYRWSFTHNTIISRSPRWWQVIRWYRLIKTICAYAPSYNTPRTIFGEQDER